MLNQEALYKQKFNKIRYTQPDLMNVMQGYVDTFNRKHNQNIELERVQTLFYTGVSKTTLSKTDTGFVIKNGVIDVNSWMSTFRQKSPTIYDMVSAVHLINHELHHVYDTATGAKGCPLSDRKQYQMAHYTTKKIVNFYNFLYCFLLTCDILFNINNSFKIDKNNN